MIAHELTHVVQQTKKLQRKTCTIIQRTPLVPSKLNVVGENHDGSSVQGERLREKDYVREKLGEDADYWEEYEFKRSHSNTPLELQEQQVEPGGDSEFLLMKQGLTYIERDGYFNQISQLVKDVFDVLGSEDFDDWEVVEIMNAIIKRLQLAIDEFDEIETNLELLVQTNDNKGMSQITHNTTWHDEHVLAHDLLLKLEKVLDECFQIKNIYTPNNQLHGVNGGGKNNHNDLDLLTNIAALEDDFNKYYYRVFKRPPTTDTQATQKNTEDVKIERSIYMHDSAQESFNMKGVWKIGEKHVDDISLGYQPRERKYNLVRAKEFRDAVDNWQPSREPEEKERGQSLDVQRKRNLNTTEYVEEETQIAPTCGEERQRNDREIGEDTGRDLRADQQQDTVHLQRKKTSEQMNKSDAVFTENVQSVSGHGGFYPRAL